MVFVLGSQLWLILLVLVAFCWPGLTILIRSMVLGLRGSQEVEAARALGASHAPHPPAARLPAHGAVRVHAAHLLRARGHPRRGRPRRSWAWATRSLPTWGQVLEDGFRTGAVFLGYWWWVVSPGLLIVITAVTFMLLALAMEPIVNPRLRRGLIDGRPALRSAAEVATWPWSTPPRAGRVRAVDGVSFDHRGRGRGAGHHRRVGQRQVQPGASRSCALLPRNGRIAGGRMLPRRAGHRRRCRTRTFRREVRWSGMAMVFQGAMHALNPVIRVGDQVGRAAARGRHGQGATREARVDELLDRVGPARAGPRDRYPHELSGGMKQRVMIAMALTHDPPLLILDEPTSALDVSIQAQIMNLLKELKAERGISMLFITHDLALASDLCDRIAVVYAGQLRELGLGGGRAGRRPRDPYTQRLLASIPRLHGDEAPAFLPGRAAGPARRHSPGCRFAARCPLVVRALRRAAAARLEVAAGPHRALLAGRPREPAVDGHELPATRPP